MLDSQDTLVIILVIAAVTALTRAMSFILFPAGRKTPAYVVYLGKALPLAIIGMLVIYCLKDISVIVYPFGLPEFLAIAAIIVIHLWKRNNLFSIVGGTILYMFLLQVVFI